MNGTNFAASGPVSRTPQLRARAQGAVVKPNWLKDLLPLFADDSRLVVLNRHQEPAGSESKETKEGKAKEVRFV